MEDKSMTELFHGKDIADKDKVFKTEMEAVNAKHIDFFKSRKSHLSSQEHDNVNNHCGTHMANGRVTFFFTDEVLPEHIKDDCMAAFKKAYFVDEQK